MAWATIASTRYAAGKLWTPELSLDLMERDWSAFTVPFDFAMTEATRTPTGTTNFTLRFVFPESWGIDLTFDSGMALYLTVGFDLVRNGAETDYGITVAFQTSSVSSASVASGAATPARRYATRSYTTLPTGVTAETLVLTVNASIGNPGAENGSATRSWGTGPDCRMVVTY